MSVVVRRQPQIILEDAITKAAIFPGESAEDFQRLLREMGQDCKPSGPVEEDLVGTLAQLTWRKNHVEDFQKAEKLREQLAREKADRGGRLITPKEIAHIEALLA